MTSAKKNERRPYKHLLPVKVEKRGSSCRGDWPRAPIHCLAVAAVEIIVRYRHEAGLAQRHAGMAADEASAVSNETRNHRRLQCNPPLKAAGQRDLALFFVDFRDQDLARAATFAVRNSESSASGLKSSPVHSISSA